MTAVGQTHAGSIAERAIALLAERGVSMRSKEIAEALGASPNSIAACMEAHVASGALLMCKVSAPSGRQTNEYRISAAGKAPGWQAMSITPGPKPGFVPRPRGHGSGAPAAAAAHPAPEDPPVTPAAERQPRKFWSGVEVSRGEGAPGGPLLVLTEAVPNPGPRFGKNAVYRNTLLAMSGDQSFVVKDATLVYPVAKKLGIKITTRQEGDCVRVWRVS